MILLNTPEIEIWPARLVHPRGNPQARVVSVAQRVLRRKRDGQVLVAETASELIPLRRDWKQQPGMVAALAALSSAWCNARNACLPMSSLKKGLFRLGLNVDLYAERTGLVVQPEPAWLALAGFDRYRRPLWLRADAARAWVRMQIAAGHDGIVLEAISGYRSQLYQLGIFQHKLARGFTIDEILAVNAAPGFSEHHSGAALDLGTPGEPPVEECFEHTTAFAWLDANAGRFGFTMSYPRDNPHGIVYEPWHWRYCGSGNA